MTYYSFPGLSRVRFDESHASSRARWFPTDPAQCSSSEDWRFFVFSCSMNCLLSRLFKQPNSKLYSSVSSSCVTLTTH